ncbi:MAG: hypothetical protein GF308_07445 [Candidatus Heimdallarchaeota archaeon]|nr:hypothetical protein [Candidatus Heimdallarchaeota archaeon]
MKEIAALKEKPDNLIPRYEELVTTQEPKRALELAKELVEEVQDLLKNWREEQGRNERDPVEKVLDNWSDIIEYYNKIASAKQKNNLVAGRFAATNYSEYALWAFATLREFSKKGKTKQEILERLPEEHQKQIKKLLQTNDLKELLTAATKVKELMEKELQQKDLELPIATTLEEARKLIKKRKR